MVQTRQALPRMPSSLPRSKRTPQFRLPRRNSTSRVRLRAIGRTSSWVALSSCSPFWVAVCTHAAVASAAKAASVRLAATHIRRFKSSRRRRCTCGLSTLGGGITIHIIRPKQERGPDVYYFSYTHSFGASADFTGSPCLTPLIFHHMLLYLRLSLSDIATSTQMIFPHSGFSNSPLASVSYITYE